MRFYFLGIILAIMAKDRFVLNEYGKGSVRTRTSKKGKVSGRSVITWDAKAVKVGFDSAEIGKETAEAIALFMMQKIQEYPAPTSPSTFRRRLSSTADGTPRDKKRYSGGKIGAKEPAQKATKWNDSGRLAAGIRVRKVKDGSWVLNVPANRLSPQLGTAHLLKELMSDIPSMTNLSAMRNHLPIRAAMKREIDANFKKDLRKVAKESLNLFRALSSVGS